MYDAIVVGARCAGSPTAMLLARKGYRVLLVDKATFPSDIMSTHYIHQPGVAQLQRWGLLEKIIASNCPPILQWSFDFGSFSLTGVPPQADGIAEAYCPRRTVLDKILVEATVAAGTELREGFTVQEVLMDGQRVHGIRGQARGGSSVTEQARIVIGADGLHSLVARTVQAPTYNEQPTFTCAYYTYWSGVPLQGTELYPRDHRFILGFPTNDGLICIAVQWPHKEFHAFRADIEGNYRKTLELAPGLAERMRGGKREERFVGTADLPHFFRKPYGSGWALVGDAGYHRDPNTAQGITDAFRDAELLAEALHSGWSGCRELAEALADYERRRNETAMPIYELTCQLASLEPPPPEMQHLFAALQGNQEQTNRFFGTIAGTVPIPQFFSPENTGRIIAGGSPVIALPEQAN
jgi:2-polyprenyl-6-methoxyphenol hydroxylase-like FAD-dependent oxidoreductase